jgi:hypothetical protein
MKKANPAALVKRTGLNANRGDLRIEPITTNYKSPEDFAAVFIARRYRLSPCMARVVASLADIGARFT